MRSNAMTLEEKLDRALAYEEIRQLACRYAVSVDARDIDTLSNLYAEGALFGGEPRTRAWIFDRFANSLHQHPLTILNVGTHVIDFEDADHAKGTVYCRCEAERGPEYWLVQQIVYLDRYVRENGAWRFLSREHLLFYGADMLQRPIGLHPAGVPENRDGKGSMPQRWPTYRAYYQNHPDSKHY
jgi:hypothetical protein